MGRYTNRFDAKRDANEPEIVKVFERRGISVHRLDKPLDLLLGYNNHNYLVEVKIPGKQLNANQVKFTNEWKGQWIMIDTASKAERLAEKILTNLSGLLIN